MMGKGASYVEANVLLICQSLCMHMCARVCVYVCAYQNITVLIMCVSVSQYVGTFNCSCVSVDHTSNNWAQNVQKMNSDIFIIKNEIPFSLFQLIKYELC